MQSARFLQKCVAMNCGLHFPTVSPEFSQAGRVACTQPGAWFPFLPSYQSTVRLCTAAWPERENRHRLLEALGGRPPSSGAPRPLPGWSSSSEPATTKSDKGPGTSWAKYWESSDSEIRESCRRRRCWKHQKRIIFSSNYFLSFQEQFVLIHGHSKQL